MAATPKDIEALHEYARGVMDRAWHHAGEVRGVALALLGAVIWRGDPDSIRIRSYDGSPANMLWVGIGGTTYVLADNHDTLKIELRDDRIGPPQFRRRDAHGRHLPRVRGAMIDPGSTPRRTIEGRAVLRNDRRPRSGSRAS